MVVFDRQGNLASRAAAGNLTEVGDARDGVVVRKRTRGPQCIGEKPWPTAA